jgi:hypothetical protein
MPRPTKLTEQIVTQIATGVSRGARPELVAMALGVGRRTYYDWVKRGRAPGPGDHLYMDLCSEIERARGLARLYLIDKISKSNDWRASAKLLEMLDADWARAAGAPEPPGSESAGGSGQAQWTIVIERKIPRAEQAAHGPDTGGDVRGRVVMGVTAADPDAPEQAPDNGFREEGA